MSQLPLQIGALVLWTASQFLICPAQEALVECPNAVVSGNVVDLSQTGSLRLRATDCPSLKERDNRILSGDASRAKP